MITGGQQIANQNPQGPKNNMLKFEPNRHTVTNAVNYFCLNLIIYPSSKVRIFINQPPNTNGFTTN